jgi:hypothetical protein
MAKAHVEKAAVILSDNETRGERGLLLTSGGFADSWLMSLAFELQELADKSLKA